MSTLIEAQQRAHRKPTRSEMRDFRARLAGLTAADVTATVNPLDTSELFVTPETSTCVDLPRLRRFLPVEWRDADVHRFEPMMGVQGTWVLRRDMPAEHTPRVWGTGALPCACTACEAYSDARLDLILPVAVDEFLTDVFGEVA